MRIGVFGGTFDPIHAGHLIVAEQCRDQAELREVWFMPNSLPPHKAGLALTRFEQRCDMIDLAIAGHAAFRLSRIEKELPPPSYTAETLAELKRRHPGDEFSLIIGADQLPEFSSWHHPLKIIEQAELLVVPRPGVMLWTAGRLAKSLGVDPSSIRMRTVACPAIEIASRDLRRAIADGLSVRYLLPRAVEEYIRERKLYQK